MFIAASISSRNARGLGLRTAIIRNHDVSRSLTQSLMRMALFSPRAGCRASRVFLRGGLGPIPPLGGCRVDMSVILLALVLPCLVGQAVFHSSVPRRLIY